MCILFHNWTNWFNPPREEMWIKSTTLHGVSVYDRKWPRLYQDRHCLDCGKYQKKYIKEIG